ncbi:MULTISPECIES: ABC transporter ATP-binding protein [unclassified Granulicatella]|uniref:ABC transporter ATP-binding protein n=1 Tax=unclassified Granulicatella TaxID=2630493 RepID=UPI001074699E|nr:MULTISPECIES: ABC transporter transmembrane domain-containing protein [unclassified Granulicatella]MBF0780583.1 ATP-binding cassette domain-containing protein [Granulicatella sp. 19428wC4_WM01]TFU94892.1 ATP-binding cassette domain-containing protein [Granulicatella sp. WM01]
MKIIGRLWWFFKLEKKRYILGIFALSLVSVTNLLPPIAIGNIVDSIASQQLTHGDLFKNLMLLIASAFAMYYLRYVWRKYILGTASRLGRLLRTQLFVHFTKMPPAFYQKYRTGDLMAHATNDINALTQLAGGGVMSAVDASITALVTLLTMFFMLSWKLTLIAILPLPFMAWATNRLSYRLHLAFKDSQMAFSELNNTVQESVSGIKVTKSFGYQKAETENFAKINQYVFRKNMKTAAHNTLFQPVTLLFLGASYTLTLLFGGYLIQQGEFTLGELITFMTYLDMLVWPLNAVGWLFNIMQRGSVSYNRIMNVLSEKSDVVEAEHPISHIKNGKLNFHIDQFAYQHEPVLRHIDFSLEAGKTLGIVGQTGSGKTTLLKLLLREIDVIDGAITLDGHNIKEYRLHDLRRLMGYVPQESLLFATSIAQNISFGDVTMSQDVIQENAKLTQIYDDIVAMEHGFDTVIGERGVSLSGGQKQRIAISRALALNPDILLLDDSLSAVDAKTEDRILTNLKENRSGKTTIITAHRLSAVIHADLIIVLQGGRIIERGTHDELIREKGWYYTTYQSQKLEDERSYHD